MTSDRELKSTYSKANNIKGKSVSPNQETLCDPSLSLIPHTELFPILPSV